MEQILAHLIGEFITQTNSIGQRKGSQWLAALIHALIYTLGFIFITQSPAALVTVFATHVLIDRFRLARFVIFAKNKIGDRRLKWDDCRATGVHKEVPVWLAMYIYIATDATLHLCFNFMALRWL